MVAKCQRCGANVLVNPDRVNKWACGACGKVNIKPGVEEDGVSAARGILLGGIMGFGFWSVFFYAILG